MRQIKFRAWDTEDKIMWMPVSLGDLIMGDYELETEDQSSSLPPADYRYFAHSKTLWMQFTGLTDRKGKEIYEGDIIKTDSGANQKVFYREDMARFVSRFNEGASIDIEKNCEVIGNIHQNPELLNTPSI